MRVSKGSKLNNAEKGDRQTVERNRSGRTCRGEWKDGYKGWVVRRGRENSRTRNELNFVGDATPNSYLEAFSWR